MQITNICNQCFYPGEEVVLVDFLQFLLDFLLSQDRHLLPLFAPCLLLKIKVNVNKDRKKLECLDKICGIWSRGTVGNGNKVGPG
jgi:hypothetical protein